MFKISNLFALIGVFVLGGLIVSAQNSASTKEKVEERTIEIFNDGGGSYLGVQTQEITKENFAKFGLKEVRGVAIEKVSEDSPAKKAGLQDGDVIVRFNGEEVTSFRKLTRLISETAPDHQAKLTIVRGGNEREINVTMGKREMPRFGMGNFEMAVPGIRLGDGQMKNPRILREGQPLKEGEFPMIPPTFNGDFLVWQSDKDGTSFVFGSTRQIGVGVSQLTKQLGDYFGVSDGKGVLINNVNENSPAAKAGLKAGDVIVEVEGKSVSNSMELIKGMNEKKEGEVNLTILRDRNRQTVKVTPEKMKESDAPFRIMTQPEGNFQFRSAPRVTSPNVKTAPRVRTIVRTL